MRFQLASFALALAYASASPVPRSIFDHTSTVSSTKHINASVDAVIAKLHDFQAMINLNPLVTSSVQEPSDPTGNTYTVTDSVPLFLGLTFPTTYNAVFTALPDGMDTNNTASAGVKLHNEWRAVANPSGGTDLTETDTITANFLLSPFVSSELETSHNQLMDTLAAQIQGSA